MSVYILLVLITELQRILFSDLSQKRNEVWYGIFTYLSETFRYVYIRA